VTTRTYSYQAYEISITHFPPLWEAQIYPAVPDLPAVDWTSNPIRAGSEREAELMAQQRIDDALKHRTASGAGTSVGSKKRH
jgi:hypothetical protein